jgi:hypothetical protein
MQPIYAIGLVALLTGLSLVSFAARRPGNLRKLGRLALLIIGSMVILSGIVSAPRMAVITLALGLVGYMILGRRGLRSSPSGQGASAGGASANVSTSWFDASLDTSTGEMDAVIKRGRFSSQSFNTLSEASLQTLYQEVAQSGDGESLRILEAYGERRFGDPDWAIKHSRAAGSTEDKMTLELAYEVLGLTQEATREDVIAAHRNLIGGVHPDRGGSSYLAAAINRARDKLLEMMDNKSTL